MAVSRTKGREFFYLHLTNNLHGSAGFRTDTQIVTKKAMRNIIAQTKTVDKSDDGDEV